MESAFIKLRTIIWILDPYSLIVQHTDMIACHSTWRPFAASAGTEFNYDEDNSHTTNQGYWLQTKIALFVAGDKNNDWTCL